MPAAKPPEFRPRAVGVARRREAADREIASDLRIAEACLRRWMAQADRDEGHRDDGLTTAERKELVELRRRNRLLEAVGARVHLAHPLGVKAFEYRRVKNDVRDATDLADLLRLGRLPEAWIAPPATRELRELVRHRAKLVGLRSHCKVEIHAVLAKCGIQVLMSDLFSPAGQDLLARCALPGPYSARVQSLLRLIDDLDVEIDLFARLPRGRLAAHPDYVALQQIPAAARKQVEFVFYALRDHHVRALHSPRPSNRRPGPAGAAA